MKRLVSEADVKGAIRDLLDSFGDGVYYEMHVPYGFGRRGIDFNVSAWGRALYIEAKRPGKYATGQQLQTLVAAYRSGAAAFIITNEIGLAALQRWLERNVHPGG